jgi:putative transposase
MKMVQPISFKRHRFPPDVIRQAVWLYFRFTLTIRDVKELLAPRGIEVSREAVRCWVNKFGPLIAANLRRRRTPPTGRWHLDEMVVKIAGRRMYLWRAVDDEGEVLDVLVQKRRNKHAALKLLRRCCQSNGNSSPPGRSEAKPTRVYPTTDRHAASAAARLIL